MPASDQEIRDAFLTLRLELSLNTYTSSASAREQHSVGAMLQRAEDACLGRPTPTRSKTDR